MDNKTFNFKHSNLGYDTPFDLLVRAIIVICAIILAQILIPMRVNNSGIFSILGIGGNSVPGIILTSFIIIGFLSVGLRLQDRHALNNMKKESCDGSIVFSSEKVALCLDSNDFSIPYQEIKGVQLISHGPVISLTITLESSTEIPELVSVLDKEESVLDHVYAEIFQEFVSRKPELNCSSKIDKGRYVLIASADK